MTRSRLLLFVGLIVIVGGLFGLRAYLKREVYDVYKPDRGEIIEAVYGLGKVKSVSRFDVKLGVLSTVRKMHVREGDFVKRGQPLVEFDDRARFTAPFDGTITLVSAYDGETAAPQVTIVRLENLKNRFIEISLEQQAALRVKRGQTAKISLESLRGQTLTGHVAALFPRQDEFLAHVNVPNLSDSVLPGMTADVSIEIGRIKDALLIPLRAVSNGAVLVQRDGRKEKIKIELGHVDGLSAEVKGDAIRPGDEILVPKAK